MNINFSEILVVLLVAFIVIKPERLPDTALMLGRWFKWLRQMKTKITHEIEEPFTAHKVSHDEPKK